MCEYLTIQPGRHWQRFHNRCFITRASLVSSGHYRLQRVLYMSLHLITFQQITSYFLAMQYILDSLRCVYYMVFSGLYSQAFWGGGCRGSPSKNKLPKCTGSPYSFHRVLLFRFYAPGYVKVLNMIDEASRVYSAECSAIKEVLPLGQKKLSTLLEKI